MRLLEVSDIVMLGKTMKVSFVLVKNPATAFNLFAAFSVISIDIKVPSTVDRCSADSRV